jgi:hypothetical protein
MKTFLCSLFFVLLAFNIIAEDDPLVMDDLLFYITNNNYSQNITIKMTKVTGTNCYDGNYNITTDFDSASNFGVNLITFAIYWKQPTSSAVKFVMGYYKVDILVTNTGSLLKTFYLDIRSSTARTNWYDMNFYYDVDNNTLTSNGNIVAINSIQTYWNLNPSGGYSPIIRQIATSGAPHIVWDEIQNLNIGDYYLNGYIVYRSCNSGVATAICTTSANTHDYYDYDFTVNNGNNTAHYWVGTLCRTDENIYQEYPKSNQVNVGVIPQKMKGLNHKPDNYFLTNYPNPFNPTTKISYTLPETSNLEITVYNAYGQEVQQLYKGLKEKGNYELQFDGKSLSSGVYYYTFKTDKFSVTKKMILLK